MKHFHVRQGDVMLDKITKLPAGLKRVQPKNGRFIVAEGEVTGHAHAIEEKGCEMYVDDKGVMYLTVETETEIVHEEHASITLPPGVYVYTPQREYHPEKIRRVED